jgi:DNA adenine methylase
MNSPLLWVGSKKKLAKRIIAKFPKDYGTYYELFAGGANVLFQLEPKHAILNDINAELMNFYQVLKENPIELERQIRAIQWDKESYYIVRSMNRTSSIKRAARFLFLVKSAFRGLYRVNEKGENTANWGYRDKNRSHEKVFLFEKLNNASKCLQNVELYNKSYETFLPTISSNDVVYLDPPYKVNENCGPSLYTVNNFTDKQHYELVDFCKELNKIDAKFVLSNSYSDETVKMYKDFNIEIIEITRQSGVHAITKKEILVYNATSRS